MCKKNPWSLLRCPNIRDELTINSVSSQRLNFSDDLLQPSPVTVLTAKQQGVVIADRSLTPHEGLFQFQSFGLALGCNHAGLWLR